MVTEGPWTSVVGQDDSTFNVVGPDEQSICSVWRLDSAANAQLIAAAPELLAACKVAAESGNFFASAYSSWEKVHAAIAKAEKVLTPTP